ncbi:MAG: SDR family NAD(P)-dependent oxidoreductase [Candidatus Mycalebacterium zealandia]|nr:MAG: SDR family NAD(P)-dependent oxidoreductase [Candidatus Mycalebacterium zealandia]
MDFVVTGCAGFVGARVCEMLLERGDRVAGMDNLNDAYDPALKEKRLRNLFSSDRFIFEKTDIADSGAVANFFAGMRGFSPKAVINLAARAGVRRSAEIPAEYYKTNVLGTLNLLEACRENGTEKFVFISSSSVYGNGRLPLAEAVSETDKPLSPYAASKSAGEGLCHSYHKLFGIDVSALRYFTVYGPAGRPDMSVFRFVRAVAEGNEIVLYGDGTQSRDFTFVDDAARATLLSVKNVGFEQINIAGGNVVSLNEIIALIEDGLSKKAVVRKEPMNPADSKATAADISKAEKILGWEPQTDIKKGVKSCIDWYLENREWASRLEMPEV